MLSPFMCRSSLHITFNVFCLRLPFPLPLSADAANITISEHFDTYQADRDIFNRFER